eukprot:XP_011614293.1 PREDICTED: putative exonuclease GOR-like protein isoform X2 [Takifugu rubripes]
MRHQVEQEQKQLSNYQTVQADKGDIASSSHLQQSKTCRSIDTGAYESLPCSYLEDRKYVVDSSKPRTDLEYDPLSNFSSDLSSYSSSRREQKLKNTQSLKKARTVGPCDQKSSTQAQLSRLASPEPLDDWMEDDVLIIDIPPSPQKKEGQGMKCSLAVTDKSQGHEKKGGEAPSILLDSPLQCSKPELLDIEEIDDKCAETKNLANLHESRERDHPPRGTFGTVLKKSLEPSGAGLTNLQANLSHVDPPHSAGKMNTPKQNFPSNTSLLYKATAATSDLQCRTRTEQARDTTHVQSRFCAQTSSVNAQSVLPHCQKPITKNPGPLLSKPGNCAEQVEKNSSSQTQTKLAESSESNQYLEKDNGRVIVIDSTSEDEINYSDIDVSDSDPMEECYRIFMEENEQKRTEELPDARVKNMEVEKVELKVKPQELVGKKRVAHEAKHSEPPAKSRPQPQVLIPLRGPEVSGFSSQPAVTSNIQQAQERASMLTASAKGAQAFLSFAGQRKPYASNAPPPLPQCPTSQAQLAPVQNAYVNYIPLGTAVIEVGNNLHLILPDSTFPVTSSSIPVTPVLTPISSMHTSMVTVKQSCPFPAIGPLQRTRSTAPILIPALARKSLTPSLAATHSGAAAPVSASAATAVKPPPHKRKVKHCESTKDKVPHDVRQRYVNMFTEEFLKTTANVNEAFEKALAEERSVYNRSVNKLKYLSVAVNALKKLKNQCVAAAKDANEGNSQQLRGNVPLNLKRCLGNYDLALYDDMKEYMLSVEKLIENNYPVRHPEKPGCAILFVDNKKGTGDPLKRICCRCGATYSVSPTGKHTRKEECTYHYGKGVTKRVPGGVETRYSCCEGVMGTPGCQVYKLHVHDSVSLDGFVSTVPRHPSNTSCPGLYALDCEMCYTIHGLELSRVTLVNSRLQVIYDTFVSPDNEVIDYNTRFSGISEEDVKGNHTSLREVQDKLLSFINADTILIGHSLETDLCALKLLHGTVVDTSVVFPHHLGPPYKLTLTSITAEHLRRIIQESVCGHDTAEDASACMELMLWKLKEDGKLKK